ncbi:hypothetical protein NLG97_g7139 [Lecanicillium saksenae]|uniref:Uncharacterized protein n=1 Tax=Lecanicillium saksenae TaxID=468837 RepID=A0ACC1QNT4_9HYPO|nr:hypothetical protein NLG97_g7139 [Lecanicillium saksenae]
MDDPADSIALENLRLTPLNLLHMPIEIQLMIYTYVFGGEPILWERRHRDECNLRPSSEFRVEHPPWVWYRPIIDIICPKIKGQCSGFPGRELFSAKYTLAETWKFCACGKRRGLNLLRTSRHIYSLAAPIFWSTTTFCFFDSIEFIACMSATSGGTRALIRGVSIISLSQFAGGDNRVHFRHKLHCDPIANLGYIWYVHTMPTFWRTVLSLPGLERLAVPSLFLYHMGSPLRGPTFRAVVKRLTGLKDLEVTCSCYIDSRIGESATRLGSHCFWIDLYNNTGWATFVSYSQRIDLRDIRDGTAEPDDVFTASLSSNLPPGYILWEIWRQYLLTGPREHSWGVDHFFPRADLVGAPKTLPVELPNSPQIPSTEIPVTFYSLPLDRHALERSKRAKGRDAPGGNPRVKHVWVRQRARHILLWRFEVLRAQKVNRMVAQLRRDAVVTSDGANEGASKETKKKRKRVKQNRRGYRHNYREREEEEQAVFFGSSSAGNEATG